MLKDSIVITNEFLVSNATNNCGWTKYQIEILGLPWPLERGWKEKVIGMRISLDTAKDFKDGRLIRSSKRNINIDKEYNLSLF